MAYEPPDRERPATPAAAGRAPAGRRLTTMLVGVAAVAAVAAVGVFAYKQGMRHGAESVAPVITAGPAPDKVKPTDPGGMEVPNQDKQIYDRLSPEAAPKPVERLLPPPETPMAPPAANTAAAQPAPPNPAASEGSPTAGAAPPPPMPPAHPGGRAEMQPPPMEAPGAPPAPPASATRKSVPPPPPPPAAMPAGVAQIAPAAGGRYRVQLAALRTEDQANQVIARNKRANADILAGLTLSVARADLGAKGIYYRVQAGPLGDAAMAKALCGRLKARKQGCLIVAP